jgi:uncharacterized YceG family protein
LPKSPTGPDRNDAHPADSSLPWDQFLGGEAAHGHEPTAPKASADQMSGQPIGQPQGAPRNEPQGAPTGEPLASGAPHPSAGSYAAPSDYESLLAGTGVGSWSDAPVPRNRRDARREAEAGSTRSARRGQLQDAPQAGTSRRRGALGCVVVLLVFIALMGVGAFALQGPLTQLLAASEGPADYSGTGEKDHVVMIHDGDTGEDIAKTLVDQDVVASFDAFYTLLLKESPAPVFQPGAYQLKTQMSARSALDALLDEGNKLEQTVVIPEGTAAVDVLQSLSEGTEIPLADLQAAAADLASFGLPAEAKSLEGFLFPATYTFTPGIAAHDAIKTLVDRQFEALDEAGVPPEKRWSTIVMASLIQREAGLKDDFYKVSRVFYNRLDPNLWESGLLQSDATVAYGTGNTHLVTTTDAERADPNNLYNTYVHPGLPIGPISNPGDLAIDAALHPADGPWLFFVTWNLDSGETIFSSTSAEHDAAVDKWLAWMEDHPEYG